MQPYKPKIIHLAVALAFVAGGVNAELARLGPVDTAAGGNGFPKWYQDKTGLALDFCAPKTQADLDNGMCLILPADVPGGTVPEVFPTKYSDEHFYWAADAKLDTRGPGAIAESATLVLALEAAFANGGPVPGDQQVFGRIRVKITSVPNAGTYTITHPYGVEVFPDMQAGDKLFFTDDVGITCPKGSFDCALATRVGPFVVPADVPGGTPKPRLVTPTGTWLSDAALPEYVTGSPYGTNIFRIEGPGIGGPGIDVLETNLFTVMGKVHTEPIPSELKVDRATYARSALDGAKIDVFATATKAIGAAEPTLAVGLVAVEPGTPIPPHTEYALDGNGQTHFSGQVGLTDPGSAPANVTVFVTSDVPPSYQTIKLADEVNITQADYDPDLKTLTIAAASGDQYRPPQLTVDLTGYVSGAPFRALPGSGPLIVTDVVAAPPQIVVISSAGGRDSVPVKTTAKLAATAVANDGTATVPEGNPQQQTSVDITLTGSNFVPGSAAITSQPAHGVVQLLSDPVTGAKLPLVRYTPAPYFHGADTFGFTVKGADGRVSNIGQIAVTVTHVNQAPIAGNDTASTTVAYAVPINVTANDSDPDGNMIKGSVVISQAPTRGVIQAVNATTGVVSYKAIAAQIPAGTIPPGGFITDTFAYRVGDGTLLSDPATVTVKLYASEQVSIASATYNAAFKSATGTKTKWTVQGRSSIPGGQTIKVLYGNASLPQSATNPLSLIGTTKVDATGAWLFQVLGSTISPLVGCGCISVVSSVGGFQNNYRVLVQ